MAKNSFATTVQSFIVSALLSAAGVKVLAYFLIFR